MQRSKERGYECSSKRKKTRRMGKDVSGFVLLSIEALFQKSEPFKSHGTLTGVGYRRWNTACRTWLNMHNLKLVNSWWLGIDIGATSLALQCVYPLLSSAIYDSRIKKEIHCMFFPFVPVVTIT